jgi:very-short-patch-repair endonuclease
MGRYVVDFYCAQLKLVLEVDGTQHADRPMADYDGERTSFLEACGIEVVRIPNELLARDSLIVEEVIDSAIRRRVSR